jgi:hypothetical protein
MIKWTSSTRRDSLRLIWRPSAASAATGGHDTAWEAPVAPSGPRAAEARMTVRGYSPPR